MSKAETLRRFIADRLAALTQEVLAAFDGVVAAYEEASPGCGLEEPPHGQISLPPSAEAQI